MTRGKARRRPGESGTAALETMMVMSFLFIIIFGFVFLCLFVVTKSMTNYAAFAAARAAMVSDRRADFELAARQVTSEVQWWPGGAYAQRVLIQKNQRGPRLARNVRRRGVRVTYLLPFGYPVFSGGGLGL